MKYTEKFQTMADAAQPQVEGVEPRNVDDKVVKSAILLDIRDPEEHQKGHIQGLMNISRGTLEMIIEREIPDWNTETLCDCNANNRGAFSAASLKSMAYVNAKYIADGLIEYQHTHSMNL